MNRYGTVEDLLSQGLTDITGIVHNQQNVALAAQTSWFEQKAVAGIPNWLLVAGLGLGAVVIWKWK